jgi:hypothetical protein
MEYRLLTVQQWWLNAPTRRVSLLNDDHTRWPSPWQIFDNLSYCDLTKALGMFYTCALCPDIRKHGVRLKLLYNIAGERVSIVDIDNGKYVLNFNDEQIVNTDSISIEYQLSTELIPENFKTLE